MLYCDVDMGVWFCVSRLVVFVVVWCVGVGKVVNFFIFGGGKNSF